MNKVRIGFTYTFECFDQGNLVWSYTAKNLIPNEAITYVLNASFSGGAQSTNFYIGLYANNRAPLPIDTMSSFIMDCGEIIDYTTTGNMRKAMAGSLLGTMWSNQSSPAEFEFTMDKTVYGGFISTGGIRQSNSGILISAVRSPSPEVVRANQVLRVIAGIELISV